MDPLLVVHEQARDELRRADAKAATVLSLGADLVPGSWPHATVADPVELLAACTHGDAAVNVARDVCVQARLAWVKYRRIGQAVTVLGVGLGLWLALAAVSLVVVLP